MSNRVTLIVQGFSITGKLAEDQTLAAALEWPTLELYEAEVDGRWIDKLTVFTAHVGGYALPQDGPLEETARRVVRDWL